MARLLRVTVMLAGISLLAIACSSDDTTVRTRETRASSPSSVTPDVSGEGLLLEVTWEPDPVTTGQPVTWFLRVTNRDPVTADLFFTSGQRGDIALVDAAGNEVYRWSDDVAFNEATANERLPAGEAKEYELPGTMTAPPGRYTAQAVFTAQEFLETTFSIEVLA